MMIIFHKKARSLIFTVFFLLFAVVELCAQHLELSPRQDSIFSAITGIKEVWARNNSQYFVNIDPDVQLRYYELSLNGRPKYFREILSDPFYDPEKYPVTFEDTLIFDPLFLPVVFTGKILVGEKRIKIPQAGTLSDIKNQMYDPFDSIRTAEMKTADYDARLRQRLYLDAVLSDNFVGRYSYEHLSEYDIVRPETMNVNVFKDLFQVENNPDFTNAGAPVRLETKRKYWIIGGLHQFQISENYISDNWYKGGEGNINLLSYQKVNIDYKKGKIQNNNLIQWDLTLYTYEDEATGTGETKTRIGTDLFRTYSDFGLAAGKNWYYSTNLELKTQFFNNYEKDNLSIMKSQFFSPFFLNVGILGMKYQLTKTYQSDKHKNLSVNADISPLSIKYTYVRDIEKIDPVKYGIPAGKNETLLFGSLINSTIKVNFSRGVSFSSRFKCFTDYQKIELESENELNLAINRYFSTRLYLYFRFDDSDGIVKEPGWGYWQLNQVLSFGLNYKW